MPNFRKYYSEEEFREKRNQQRKKYYEKTERFGRRPWTPEEDKAILVRSMTDIELSKVIKRSAQAIQIRRSRLKSSQEEE